MRRLLPVLVLGLLAGCEGREATPAPAATTAAEPAPAATTPAEAAPAGRSAAAPILTAEGYGPVRIGMSEAEARRLLGPGVGDNGNDGPPGEPRDPNACRFIWAGVEPEDVVYMIEEQRVSRITVASRGRSVRTGEGLGLGATEAAVRAAYGDRLQTEPHKYVEAPAKYLTAWTVPDQRGVRYETDAEGLVSEIHAGGPSIQYVEGCS